MIAGFLQAPALIEVTEDLYRFQPTQLDYRQLVYMYEPPIAVGVHCIVSDPRQQKFLRLRMADGRGIITLSDYVRIQDQLQAEVGARDSWPDYYRVMAPCFAAAERMLEQVLGLDSVLGQFQFTKTCVFVGGRILIFYVLYILNRAFRAQVLDGPYSDPSWVELPAEGPLERLSSLLHLAFVNPDQEKKE